MISTEPLKAYEKTHYGPGTLVHSELYVGRTDGMGLGWVGMVIIGRR